MPNDEKSIEGGAVRTGWLNGYPAFRSLCVAAVSVIGLLGPVAAQTITLKGQLGYEEHVSRDLIPGSIIDMRHGEFRVANSRNSDPSEGFDCDAGALPLNRYPVRVYQSVAVALLGGRFDGETPQGSDWAHTYCNSTALGLWDSPYGVIDGLRARRVWDGIRISRASPHFRINRVWLSDVRDDCIENDHLQAGGIRDSLLDGCFSALSIRAPQEADYEGTDAMLTLVGLLIRLKPYPYKGALRHGFVLKAETASPRVTLRDSVIAMSDADLINPDSLRDAFGKIADCDNNLFLWMSDKGLPDALLEPPECFRVITGGPAEEAWQSARQNWIDCHFQTMRFDDDTPADPTRCDRFAYGGQY